MQSLFSYDPFWKAEKQKADKASSSYFDWENEPMVISHKIRTILWNLHKATSILRRTIVYSTTNSLITIYFWISFLIHLDKFIKFSR